VNITKEQAWELSLLALCVWREARGESLQGKIAVAWSIRNRVTKPGVTWWGDDWEEVIEHKFQYSSFNPDDPNAKKLPGDPSKDASWRDSLLAAEQAYTGAGLDPTNGATHYYAPSVVAAPAWTKDKNSVFKTKIGAHEFWIAA